MLLGLVKSVCMHLGVLSRVRDLHMCGLSPFSHEGFGRGWRSSLTCVSTMESGFFHREVGSDAHLC